MDLTLTGRKIYIKSFLKDELLQFLRDFVKLPYWVSAQYVDYVEDKLYNEDDLIAEYQRLSDYYANKFQIYKADRYVYQLIMFYALFSDDNISHYSYSAQIKQVIKECYEQAHPTNNSGGMEIKDIKPIIIEDKKND